MSNVTTPNQLTGLFKEVYADQLENLIPESAKLVKMITFSERDRLGDKYNMPVVLTTEQGVSYASHNAGAFDLDSPVSMSTQNAEVVGSQMLLRSALSYDAIFKASGSKTQFVKATELVVDNMLESITKRLEVGLIHGQRGIGDTAIGGFTNVGAGVGTFVVTTASWASGIWAGSEGARISFVADLSDTISATTNVNPNTTATDLTITSVDVDTRTVTIKGDAAVITAVKAANTKVLTVFYKGTTTGSGASFEFIEMAGLGRIFANNTTMFNINAGKYNLWKGNTVDAAGKLTMAKVVSAVGKAVQRGLNEKVVLIVNPQAWADLASELAALRKFDGSYSKTQGENGFESLKYYGQSGEIEVISHNIMKEGEAMIFPPKRIKRIGSQDITFNSPMESGGEIFLSLPNKAGVELRCYSNQSVFVETPARCVLITGIVNS